MDADGVAYAGAHEFPRVQSTDATGTSEKMALLYTKKEQVIVCV